MKKALIFLVFILFAFTILYFLGPKPKEPILSATMPQAPTALTALFDSIQKSEKSLPLKEGNEAKIIWANDSLPQKTSYSLVYLHGFSASQMEGNPLNVEFAKRYGLNLFLAREALHGLKDPDAFTNLTADTLFSTAKMALKIGTKIGDSVILMATSAGGALALTLAAKEENLPIKGLILYSPCIKIFDPNSVILDKPWGLSLARIITKGQYLIHKDSAKTHKYWYNQYRLEGVVALQSLLDKSMKKITFQKIHVPILCLAYYKDNKVQDSTVSVPAIRTMFSELATPKEKKEYHELPNVGAHVMACYITSKDLNSVREATFHFAENTFHLKRVN